ncbi:MAG: HEAT repeat domain-containing protein [Isosphaeraceae bacterium]
MLRSALLVIALLNTRAALAAPGAEQPAIDRGVQFVRGRVGNQQVGETALVALALSKAEVPANDPTQAAALAKIQRRFNGSVYQPERTGGAEIYEAGVIILALGSIDPQVYQPEIKAAAQYILGKQNANGSWDYTGRIAGDTSISQYAVLGLWEAENSGVAIPPRAWDKAASWYLSVQHPSQGSWNYHRDEGSRYPETVSMTAAGVGSLLICQRQLDRHRRSADTESSLLTPLMAENRPSIYHASTPVSRVNAGVRKGLAWLGSHFDPEKGIMGHSAYYGLYGIERIGALAERDSLGGEDWFDEGARFALATQQADGSWTGQYGEVNNTVWTLLFLTKSTAQTLKKIEIKRLGAGTLLGGRGLPKDLSSLTVAQGRVVVRPMNGAVDAMLDVLADPRARDADSALAGLVERYQKDGPKVLRPHKDRLRKLLDDRDPGVRAAAAWTLGRTADLDVVPALIAALRDPDEAVVAEARTGLQVISRKLDGYGPPPGASPKQREEAANRWRAWYDSVRPPDLDGPDAGLN